MSWTYRLDGSFQFTIINLTSLKQQPFHTKDNTTAGTDMSDLSSYTSPCYTMQWNTSHTVLCQSSDSDRSCNACREILIGPKLILLLLHKQTNRETEEQGVQQQMVRPPQRERQSQHRGVAVGLDRATEIHRGTVKTTEWEKSVLFCHLKSNVKAFLTLNVWHIRTCLFILFCWAPPCSGSKNTQ